MKHRIIFSRHACNSLALYNNICINASENRECAFTYGLKLTLNHQQISIAVFENRHKNIGATESFYKHNCLTNAEDFSVKILKNLIITSSKCLFGDKNLNV